MADQKVEYAKVVKVLATGSNRGFQTQLTLPSATTMTDGGSYINFYCGLAGFECGISKPGGQTKWHWFVNNANGETNPPSQPFIYSDGSNVTIKLYIDDTTSKINFAVNGAIVHTSTNTYSSASDARLIIAACSTSWVPTAVPSPLPAWNVWHNQVVGASMKYKNATNAWINVTSSNSTATPSHTPNVTTPVPVNYTYDANSLNLSTIYASLKQA